MDEFTTAGGFVSQVAPRCSGRYGTRTLAIGRATGQVYVPRSRDDVDLFNAKGEHEATWEGKNTPAAKSSDECPGVAVDNSTNPSDP